MTATQERLLVAKFKSRGIGLDRIARDFVTGAEIDAMFTPNIAAYVPSEAMDSVVAMFGGYARCDRDMIKVGVTEENKTALEELERLVRMNGNNVTTEIVEAARRKAPNYQGRLAL